MNKEILKTLIRDYTRFFWLFWNALIARSILASLFKDSMFGCGEIVRRS
jgi:hypothetical protein